jgi:hypothetical protein
MELNTVEQSAPSREQVSWERQRSSTELMAFVESRHRRLEDLFDDDEFFDMV